MTSLLVRPQRKLVATLPLLAVLAAPATPAQVSWTQHTFPDLIGPRYGAAMVYDSHRRVVVLVGGVLGGGETWEWDGAWSRRTPTVSPPPTPVAQAMAYDAARQRAVLFDGSETWEWDGVDWSRRQPAASPGPRIGHCVAYDTARARVVLFGGYVGRPYGASFPLADTWEWDGTNWHQLVQLPSTRPPARANAAMAYDAGRGRVVLFGGTDDYFSASTQFDDTWEWNGKRWTEVTSSSRPPAREQHAIAYDAVRGRVVMFGGHVALRWSDDTWEWNGTAWTEVVAPITPPAREQHEMVYDASRQRVVMFGGVPDHSDTWLWDGTSWSEQGGPGIVTPRSTLRPAYDAVRERVVLFGGAEAADTWEWDGAVWSKRVPATRPPARRFHAAAGDSGRGRIVVFGGASAASGNWLGDTWEWDGNDWSLAASTGPSARQSASMTYDADRARVVLFGGSAGPVYRQYFGDTWEWDGSSWSQVAGAGPTARDSHGMVFDSRRRRVVLYGGIDSTGFLADTWEWDGSTWAARTPAANPGPRGGHQLAYDEARGRVVLFGGVDGSSWRRDTWEWDGSDWVQRAPVSSPSALSPLGMVYVPARRTTLLIGGWFPSETWEYGPLEPASTATFGAGCPGVAGVAELAPLPGTLPWLGASFGVSLTRLPATNLAFVWLGGSRTMWAGLPLPFALGTIGAPACSLLVSPDVTVLLPVAAGQASWSFGTCSCPALAGASIYLQGGALDASAPGGLVLSNGLDAVLGAR